MRNELNELTLRERKLARGQGPGKLAKPSVRVNPVRQPPLVPSIHSPFLQHRCPYLLVRREKAFIWLLPQKLLPPGQQMLRLLGRR